jgi:hypothetical protein
MPKLRINAFDCEGDERAALLRGLVGNLDRLPGDIDGISKLTISHMAGCSIVSGACTCEPRIHIVRDDGSSLELLPEPQ